MAAIEKDKRGSSKEGGLEKISRLYRNWNVVGAVALGGAAIVVPSPVLASLLAVGAGVNALQASAGELARRQARKSRKKSDI